MPKGKPWAVEEENQLGEMVQAGKRISEIAAFFGKSQGSIKKKMKRLGLEVVVQKTTDLRTTTSNVILPAEKQKNI
jgi:O-acetylhomoserine/O-acetylserine sulfhydrylase-like pyridoxal-dependent enzyme